MSEPPPNQGLKTDIYLEMYRQCHEHLRATDNKRDQILAFYAIVVGVFFILPSADRTYTNWLLWGLFAFGIVLAIALIRYREWHIVYNDSAIAVHILMYSSVEATKSEIETAWQKASKEDENESAKWRVRTEDTIFVSFVVLLLLPIVSALPQSGANYPPCLWWLLPLVGSVVGGLAYLYVRVSRQARATGHEQSWILDALVKAHQRMKEESNEQGQSGARAQVHAAMEIKPTPGVIRSTQSRQILAFMFAAGAAALLLGWLKREK